MELYQAVIDRLEALLDAHPERREYPYDAKRCWPETERFELVLGKDSAYELGASGKGAANYTCVCGDDPRWKTSRTIVIGKDLQEIRTDNSYARLVILEAEEGLFGDTSAPNDSEKAFRILQKLDFIKYHVFAKGFMIRTSAENFREQVRVEKKALKLGMSFEQLGNTFLKHYLEADGVKSACVIFLSDPAIDYDSLLADAKKVHAVTMTLSRILEGIPTDCSLCSLKPICDEVEGMRELHFGKGGMG